MRCNWYDPGIMQSFPEGDGVRGAGFVGGGWCAAACQPTKISTTDQTARPSMHTPPTR